MTHPQSPTAALLPCPFCGGAALVTERAHYSLVNCGSAHCNMDSGCKAQKTEDAIAAWNTRAHPHPTGWRDIPVIEQYEYALARLGLKDSPNLRVIFWDAREALEWDASTDWYITPDAPSRPYGGDPAESRDDTARGDGQGSGDAAGEKAIYDAIDILTTEADILRECHTNGDDDWTGEPEAKTDYERMLRTVEGLHSAMQAMKGEGNHG